MRTQKVNYIAEGNKLIRVYAYLCKDGQTRVFKQDLEEYDDESIAINQANIRNLAIRFRAL